MNLFWTRRAEPGISSINFRVEQLLKSMESRILQNILRKEVPIIKSIFLVKKLNIVMIHTHTFPTTTTALTTMNGQNIIWQIKEKISIRKSASDTYFWNIPVSLECENEK